MDHLTLDALARLVDEAPGASEREHLRACAACRSERDALREQTSLLTGLGRIDPPAGSWDAVQARLRSEGLLRAPARRVAMGWTRAAAAVLVVVGAAALTLRALAGSGEPVAAPRLAAVAAVPPIRTTQPVAPAQPLRTPGAAAANGPASAPHSRSDIASVATKPETATTRRFAAAPPAGATRSVALPAVADEEVGALEQLAAWEGIVLATGDVLERAPTDPVANGFHFAALRQRDAALRTLALTSHEPWF